MENREPNAGINDDIYKSTKNSMDKIRGETGLVFDKRMAEHRCLWDPNYPERPERFTQILERYKPHCKFQLLLEAPIK